MFKQLHPNIQIRIFTSFLSRVIGSMIFPFMAIYFTHHMNATMAGILLMINVVFQFIASLYGGYLADIVGRKRMMVLGEWIKVIAFIGMLLANSPLGTSAWLTFFMMLAIGTSSGLTNPAAEAMLIDVSTKETRAFMYSINYWAVNLSLMLGLIIGGWLYKTHFFELLIGLSVMSFVTLWMTTFLIKETYMIRSKPVKGSYGIKPILKSYQVVMKDLPFLLFTLAGIAILSIEFQRNNFISVRLEAETSNQLWHWGHSILIKMDGVRLMSLLTVENTVLIVLFTALFTKLIRNKAEQPIMYAGFILFGIGFALMAFSNSLVMLFTAGIILTIGELMYVPTRQSILAEIVDDSRRGAYMAFNGFVFQFGKMFGAIGIIIGEKIGGVGMGGLILVFALLGIFFSVMSLQRKQTKLLLNKVN